MDTDVHSEIQKSLNALKALSDQIGDDFQQMNASPDLPNAMVEFGFHSPSHYIHEIEKLGKEVGHLTEQVTDLTQDWDRAKQALSTLSGNVLGKAEGLEKDVVQFADNLEKIAKDLYQDKAMVGAFKDLLAKYFDTALAAIKSLLSALKSDVANLVSIDRLKRLLALATETLDEVQQIGEMVVSLAKQAVSWTETAMSHVKAKWAATTGGTKKKFLAEVRLLREGLQSVAQVHLPIKMDQIFDKGSFDKMLALVEIVPDSIWQKTTSMLNLAHFEVFPEKVGLLVGKWDNKEDIHDAASVLIALGKSYKSWFRMMKLTFKVEINGKLLDYLKAKITGGGDFGVPDADVNADPGTGLTLGIDFFSISGLVIGIALAILALVLLVGHLVIDLV